MTDTITAGRSVPLARRRQRRARPGLGPRRNAETVAQLAGATAFDRLRTQIREVLDSDDRIPYVRAARRAPLQLLAGRRPSARPVAAHHAASPYRADEPAWEVLLDVDALGAAEDENWVWQRRDAACARTTSAAWSQLSRGGADAVVVREFDLAAALRRRRVHAARGEEPGRLDRRRPRSTSAPTSARAR